MPNTKRLILFLKAFAVYFLSIVLFMGGLLGGILCAADIFNLGFLALPLSISLFLLIGIAFPLADKAKKMWGSDDLFMYISMILFAVVVCMRRIIIDYLN